MKNSFFAGIRTILPFLLFVLILDWIWGILSYWIECIESLIPQSTIDSWGLPEVVIKIFGVLILCAFVSIIGMIARQPKMSCRFNSWLAPLIYRTPLLGYLFKITNQVTSSLKDKESFKKVVLVKFPTESSLSLGFLTGENPTALCEAASQDELVTVFVPTTPNPTSGFLMLFKSKDVIETDFPVSSAITFIISLGAAGATQKVLKESHSCMEWDFFYCFLS